MQSGDDLTIVLFLVGTAISIALAAMSAAGWRHPALIASLFSLAGMCLFIGVAWPALKTVSPPTTAMVNQVATNPVAIPPASSNRACRRRWIDRLPARCGFTMTATG
jgi:hypothetical protein